jgi:diguanylate cyclase (GGDEF)-like protein
VDGLSLPTGGWLLLASGGLSLTLTVFSFCRQKEPVASLLGLALLSQTWWAVLSALSLGGFPGDTKIILARASFVGVFSCIPLFLLFSLQTGGLGSWINSRTVIVIFALPALILLPAVWLFGEDSPSLPPLQFLLADMIRLPELIYGFIVLSLTFTVFILKWRRPRHPLFRWQAILSAAGALSVSVAAFHILAGGIHALSSPFIPFLFLFSSALLSAAILRFQLFDVQPISTDEVVESAADGMVALDNRLRVVGLNLAARAFIEQPDQAVGRPAADIFTSYPALQAALESARAGESPALILFAPIPPAPPLEISLRRIPARAGEASGWLLVFHNLMPLRSEIEKERGQRLLAESLSRAALTFTKTMDVEETLHRILEECVVNIPNTWATLQMIDPQGRAKILCLRGPSSSPETIRWLRSVRPVVAETATLAWMASTGQPLIIPDLLEPDVDRRSFNLGRSYLGAPLRAADDVAGFISFYHAQPEFYTSSHLLTLNYFVELASVVLENNRSFQITQDLANIDGLTGLNNRRYFFLLAAKEMRRSVRFKKNLSLLMVDLDYFKEINDTYGHQVGDNVLKHLGHLIRESLREIDIAGRYGGDEFAILMPETSEQNAEILGNRIREKIRENIFLTEAGKVRFTASLGLASRREEHKTFEDLMEAADRALYQAKRSGRDRLEMAQSQMEIAI